MLPATPRFRSRLRSAGPSRAGAPSCAPIRGRHGLAGASAVAVATYQPRAAEHRPPSRRAREPGNLLARGRRPHRRLRTSPLRRARVPRVPDVWSARPRVRAGSVRELRVRAPRTVLVQTTRLLSELRRPPHGGAGGTPRRSRPAARPRAPVGAHAAAPPAL